MNWRRLKLSRGILHFVLALAVLVVLLSTEVLMPRVSAQRRPYGPWPAPGEKVPSYTIPRNADALPGYLAPEDNYRLGPVQEVEVFETEHRLYRAPFHYKNVAINYWVEYSEKGIEIDAEMGSITIREEKPIVSVTVVGTGCETPGYNIVEWWADGENVSNQARSQLMKRQRIENLRGQHPQWLHQAFVRKQKFKSLEEANEFIETMQRAVYSKSFNFTVPGSIMGGLYENTAYFTIGSATTFEETASRKDGDVHRKVTGRTECHQVVIRGGSMDIEDPGRAPARFPGDYAVRLIDLVVKKK